MIPALKEIEQHTDIKADFIVYEKSGKTVLKIKFRIQANSKNTKALHSPKRFLQAIESPKERSDDLADSATDSKIYQSLSEFDIALNRKVKNIIIRSNEDEDYKVYVKDTIARCIIDFERDSTIKNKGGYLLAAIKNDYHKTERTNEQEKAKKIQRANSVKQEHAKIQALVEEGKTSFYAWRKPFISNLKDERLTDSLVSEIIAEKASNASIAEKLKQAYAA